MILYACTRFRLVDAMHASSGSSHSPRDCQPLPASTLNATLLTLAQTPPPETSMKHWGTLGGTETSRKRGQMWLQLDITPLATTRSEVASYADQIERLVRSRTGPKTTWTKPSEEKCACKGHCRVYKHRFKPHCECTELVIGTNYCNRCQCIVAGCGRPKNRIDFCFRHQKVFQGLHSASSWL